MNMSDKISYWRLTIRDVGYKLINSQGEGFDCRTNKINGDGEWSNVAAQRKWIENRLIPGAGKGPKNSMTTLKDTGPYKFQLRGNQPATRHCTMR